jgi:hypothetical protein
MFMVDILGEEMCLEAGSPFTSWKKKKKKKNEVN